MRGLAISLGAVPRLRYLVAGVFSALLLAGTNGSAVQASIIEVDIAEVIQVDGAAVNFSFGPSGGLLPVGASTFDVFFEISALAGEIGTSVGGFAFSFLSGPADATFLVESIGLRGVNGDKSNSGETFGVDTSPGLPSLPPISFFADISSATSTLFALQVVFDNPGGNLSNFAGGSLTAVSAPILSTPLPAAVWLFISGIGILGAAGWRRQRAT